MYAFLIFGDSISFGRGNNIGWISKFKKEFQAKHQFNTVYDLTIPGEDSAHLVARFSQECKARITAKESDRFVIIIDIGLNDIQKTKKTGEYRVGFDNFKKNILQMIKEAKKFTSDVIMFGQTPVDDSRSVDWKNVSYYNSDVKKLNKALYEVSSDESIQFIDFESQVSDNFTKELLDGVHPGEKGYTEMYDIITNSLKDLF